MNIINRLKAYEHQNKKIKVGLVGTGQMGTAMLSQMAHIPGYDIPYICSHHIEKAREVALRCGIDSERLLYAKSADEADNIVKNGKIALIEDYEILPECEGIDVMVDATGIVEVGAVLGEKTLQNEIHLVNLNVEADVVFGNYLMDLAKKKNVIYTGSAGDEPGALMELYYFAEAMGLKTLVLGKGKNNPLRVDAIPDELIEEGKKKGTKPKMLASFVDGTKTMIEMCAVANATGFCPDIRGMHGVTSGVEDLLQYYALKTEGGILNGYGVVDFAKGVAPGVFAIVTSEERYTKETLRYLSMGEGPNYVLYRPYHLTALETPITIAKAFFYGEATICPKGIQPTAETVAVAKKDMKAGESFDEIGEYTVYGTIETYEEAKAGGHIPIGLFDHHMKAKVAIPKGTMITEAMVEHHKAAKKYELRKKQEAMIEGRA